MSAKKSSKKVVVSDNPDLDSETHERLPRFVVVTNSLDGRYQNDVLRGIKSEVINKARLLVLVAPNRLPGASETDYNLPIVPDPNGVDGIILLSGTIGLCAEDVRRIHDLFNERSGPRVPLVSIGVEAPGVTAICTKDEEGIHSAVDHLREEHDVHHIAFICGPNDHEEAKRRLAAFREAMGADCNEQHIVPNGDFTFSFGYNAAMTLLEASTTIEAIMAGNDEMARGALCAVKELEGAKPRTAVVGFDDTEFASASGPSLTTIRQPLEESGRKAAKLAMEAFEKGEMAPETIYLPTTLQRRESCGCNSRIAMAEARQRQRMITLISQLMPTQTAAEELNSAIIDIIDGRTDWTLSFPKLKRNALDKFIERLESATSGDIAGWYHAVSAFQDICLLDISEQDPRRNDINKLFGQLRLMVVKKGSSLAARSSTQLQWLREYRKKNINQNILHNDEARASFQSSLADLLQKLPIHRHCIALRTYPSSVVVADTDSTLINEKFQIESLVPQGTLPDHAVAYAFRSAELQGHVVLSLGEAREWWVLGEVAESVAHSFDAILLEGVFVQVEKRPPSGRPIDVFRRHELPSQSQMRELAAWKRLAENDLAQLQTMVPYDRASVQLLSESERSVFLSRGFSSDKMDRSLLRPLSADDLVGKIVESRKPVFSGDVLQLQGWDPKNPGVSGIVAWIGVPLYNAEKIVGFATFDFKNPVEHIEEFEDSVEWFTRRMSALLAEVQPMLQQERERALANALAKTNEFIAGTLDEQQVLDKITEHVATYCNCSHCAIFLSDSSMGKPMLTVKSSAGNPAVETRMFEYGEGIAGMVFSTGEGVLLHEAQEHEKFAEPRHPSHGSRSMIVVPIKVGDQIFGVICADQDTGTWFSINDKLAISAFAQQAGIAIQRYTSIRTLWNITERIVTAQEQGGILETAIDCAVQLVNADAGSIFSFSEEKRGIDRHYRYPSDFKHPEPNLEKPNDIVAWVAEHKEPHVLLDVNASNSKCPAPLRGLYKSLAAIPLVAKDRVTGVLIVYTKKAHHFAETELFPLETLASMTAIGLEKSSAIQRKRAYGQILARDILPYEDDWQLLRQSLEKTGKASLSDLEFLSAVQTLWTVYQKRKGMSGIEISEEQEIEENYRILLRYLTCHSVPLSEVVRAVKGIMLRNGYLIEGTGTETSTGTGLPKVRTEPRQAVVAVLGHIWREVYTKSIEEDFDFSEGGLNTWRSLLSLTGLVLSTEIAGDGLPIVPAKKQHRVDRDVLRLYFGVLLANSVALRRRYLGIPETGEAGHRGVAEQVRRGFVISLARYMRGLVDILERRAGLATAIISRAEVLDALLYLVDRYAHVVLDVDERLDIRAHLSMAMSTEVRLHMAHDYYRDHLLHVIDVFLLGHWLLETKIPDGRGIFVAFEQRLRPFMSGEQGSLMKNWAVAALLHDIGYQALTGDGKLAAGAPLKPYFSAPDSLKGDWPHFGDCNAESLPRYLEQFLSEEILRTEPPWIPPSPEKYFSDHGVLSAIRVAAVIRSADTKTNARISSPCSPLLAEYKEALHAIAHHNLFSTTVAIDKYPLSCLLRLCDEMQEWGRRRVDVEQMVKQLYLEIEEDYKGSIQGYELLSSLEMEAKLTIVPNDNCEGWRVGSDIADSSTFLFTLNYLNPVDAKYDAVTTMLSKGYNLQHIDLDGINGLVWHVGLRFPIPPEYRGLSELDIYGLSKERLRTVPELWEYTKSEAIRKRGMFRIAPPPNSEGKPEESEMVGITVVGPCGGDMGAGLQTVDPGELRGLIIDIKRQILTGRLLGREICVIPS